MVKRIALDVVLILVITIALAWIALAVLSLVEASDPVAAVVDAAPRMLFGIMGPALALWTLLLVIGGVVTRHRGAGGRIAAHLITLVISVVAMLIVLTVLAFATPGGWGMLLVAIALAPGLAVALAGTIAVLLVELVILKPTAPSATIPAPDPTTP